MKQVNWGIIGLGNIALKFAQSFKFIDNAIIRGISSKDSQKLEYFKKKFQIDEKYCFADYEELLDLEFQSITTNTCTPTTIKKK